METKVVSEPRGAEVESEPGAEFQPLLWDVDVGRRLCTGTVVAYLSLFALVTSSLHTCGNPDSTQKSSCFGAAAMMLTAFAMTRLPWRREKNATWARSCTHVTIFVSAATNVAIGLGMSPVCVDMMTGRQHYMLRWVEWSVLSFTMTFATESAAAASSKTALRTALTQSGSTLCGLLLPLCRSRFMWIAVAIISFALYIFIFWRVYDHWLNFQNAKAYESRTSMRRRSMELSFYLISACAATWSGFVVIWSADALLYGVFGVPRGPFDFSFYWDLFIDVLAKLVYADAIESSAPLLKIRFSLDALETAGELRRLFDKANAPIFGVDDQCRVAEWNEKATSITGYSARETIGQDLVERFVAPEIRASVRRVLQKALRGHETSNFELVLVDKAENRVRVLLNATTRRNVDGAIVGVVGIGQDVTEMRKVEDKARQYAGAYSERLLRSFDLSLDLVTQIDFAKENAPSIYYASPSFRAVLGHSPHDVLGDCAQLEMLFSTQSLELLRLFIQQMRSGKDGVTVEYPMLHIDGHEVWFEHKASRHPENPDCVIVVSRDITDRRERHRLEVENARLSAARERDIEAMHFLSHELKNRFVAIRGLTESAQLSVAEYAPNLLSAPHNVREVFSDTLAGIDRGIFLCMNQGIALQLAHETYRPHATHVDLRSALQAASGRRAEVSVDPELPELVHLDMNLVMHVLENFITNAVRYGAVQSRITLHAKRQAGRLCCEVINMPGVRHREARTRYGDTEASAKIEAELAENSSRLQRDATSTGNGLRIARKCTLLLGGELTLHFLADRVVAAITLPLNLIETNVRLSIPAGLRVASLDDDDVIRRLDVRLFAKLGIDAHVRGATPEEILGFPAFVASLDPQPHLVLLDQMLDHPLTGDPLARGTDLVAPLRAAGFTGRIAIKSANQSSAERAEYLESGADGSLDKALQGEAFARELAAIVHRTTAQRVEPIAVNVLGALMTSDDPLMTSDDPLMTSDDL